MRHRYHLHFLYCHFENGLLKVYKSGFIIVEKALQSR